jgi:hypothetical protein
MGIQDSGLFPFLCENVSVETPLGAGCPFLRHQQIWEVRRHPRTNVRPGRSCVSEVRDRVRCVSDRKHARSARPPVLVSDVRRRVEGGFEHGSAETGESTNPPSIDAYLAERHSVVLPVSQLVQTADVGYVR